MSDHSQLIASAAGPPTSLPTDFSLWHYIKEGVRIICWDDEAIRRVKDDRRVLRYGIAFWVFANTLPVLVHGLGSPPFHRLFLRLAITLLPVSILAVMQLGVVHLIAKYFCAGDGSFVQILRPLSLASLILLVQMLPMMLVSLAGVGISVIGVAIAGSLLGGIAWVAVMVMVFDVVDGMQQLTTFLISIATGVALNILFVIAVRLTS